MQALNVTVLDFNVDTGFTYRDETPPNTPQRARIVAQQNERDNRFLDSPQHHRLPHAQTGALPQAPPFQQASRDVFGGGPIHLQQHGPAPQD
jgi:hypothetical protein